MIYKVIFVAFFILILQTCSKDDENQLDRYYSAKVVGYDLNCSTCLLEFPQDSVFIKHVLKNSGNLYNTVNLKSNSVKIGQNISVKFRPAKDQELPVCIALYASITCANIYIIDYK